MLESPIILNFGRLAFMVLLLVISSFCFSQSNGKAKEYFDKGVAKKEQVNKVTDEERSQNPFVVNELLNSAIKFFTAAISIDPSLTHAYFERALCFQRLSEYKKAIADFQKVLLKDPDNFDALRFLSFCQVEDPNSYMNRSILTDAMETLNRLIRLKPNDHSLYSQRSSIKMRLQDNRGAILDLNQAIALLPDHYYYFSQRASCWYRLKNFCKSIQDYTKAIELSKDDYPLNRANLYDSRAYAKFNSSDLEGACLDWSQAGELGMPSAYDAIRTNCNN